MTVRLAHTVAPRTLGEAVKLSLARSVATSDGVGNPVAVLWTDSDGQWRELARVLAGELPELYTIGPYAPDARTGPAIWLRCVTDGALGEAGPPKGSVPVLYLPGVSRQDLRAGTECPPALQPMVELQYRGTVWHQRNGRDWTVEAFLTSEDGVGLDVARDARTREAMLRALAPLADTLLSELKGRSLTADDFDSLTIPDPQRDLLLWMHEPDAFRGRSAGAPWDAFRNLVRSQFALDPEDAGLEHFAHKLAEGEGVWANLWQRFSEAPARYRSIAKLLREPFSGQGSLLIDPSRLPTVNDEAERRLRAALEDVTALPHHQACERVLALETEHAKRRGWVWAELKESPYATALEHLARLALHAQTPLGGTSVEDAAARYAREGWQVDQAAMSALASGMAPAAASAIAKVVHALYEPWADASARHFQALAAGNVDLRSLTKGVTADPGTCLVFADGLRFDLSMMLKERLEMHGLRARMSHRLAPVPSVTATAKPLATPIHASLNGVGSPADFQPTITASGLGATAPRLRELMADQAIEVMDEDEVRLPASEDAIGWTEIGRIDELGHQLDGTLAGHVAREVERIAERVIALLEAGWPKVRVVTDHGWLLLPGGLPKVELPIYLVESRWARCATVKAGATPDIAMTPWYWNPEAQIASPPGIGAYRLGVEYAHGGLSSQECVVPDLVVERGAVASAAKIIAIEWRRLRCVVRVSATDPAMRVDIRTNWKQPATRLVAAPKAIGNAGEASFAVSDEHEGQGAMVVVLDSADNVLDKVSTTVGGHDGG